MDKLEQYLDLVCRGIAGPRPLRQHIRQELREHLLDAAAEHQRAGMPEAEAIARALEDFGGPEQVRRELEAAHGHRVMAVVIDKALQWKEMTMKAKWLWTSWAHLALAGVVGLEVLFISLTMMFVAPKCQVIVRNFGRGHEADPIIAWMARFFVGADYVQHYLAWGLLALAACWALFEWRVRSENKPFMRLSALATAAVGLMMAVILTAASLLLPVVMVAPMAHG